MKKVVLGVILLLIPFGVFAHPGRTDGSGCHTCRTNCGSWGLYTGQYHCHNAKLEKEEPVIKEQKPEVNIEDIIKPKSSNKEITYLMINNKRVNIKDGSFYYETLNKDISVTTKLEDRTLKYKFNDLKPGDNIKSITVTALDETTKDYLLTIKYISDINTLDEIYVDELKVEIKPNVFKYSVELEEYKDEINIKTTPTDINSTVKGDGVFSLNDKEKVFAINVKAMNGKEQLYQIKVINKEEEISYIYGLIIWSIVVVIVIFGVYFKFSKKKNI